MPILHENTVKSFKNMGLGLNENSSVFQLIMEKTMRKDTGSKFDSKFGSCSVARLLS